ncbi:hypothetical protein T484DRAFT_1803269 [Baffinella frigidus]|nr:hypothetical protein T484DRAFT_1803269 [Cryptophyta sp. CCMP2293]
MGRLHLPAALLLLAVARAGGTPRELVGWTAAGRNSRDASGFTAGACAGAGKIVGCVLYSQCGDFGLNLNGSLPFTGFYTFHLGVHSVIAGRGGRFPAQLPTRLQIPHHTPDALHPNLKFWFAPEALEEGGEDGGRVGVWRNMANECWEGHFDAFKRVTLNGAVVQAPP